jgi:hypothetical protein
VVSATSVWRWSWRSLLIDKALNLVVAVSNGPLYRLGSNVVFTACAAGAPLHLDRLRSHHRPITPYGAKDIVHRAFRPGVIVLSIELPQTFSTLPSSW